MGGKRHIETKVTPLAGAPGRQPAASGADEVGADPAPATPWSPLSYRPALKTLDEISKLSEDWDSYGAAPPTAPAISAAYRLVWRVAEQFADGVAHAVPWVIAPLADGGIQVEWRGEGDAIEVEIAPDGSIGYLVEHNGETLAKSDGSEATTIDEVLGRLRPVVAP